MSLQPVLLPTPIAGVSPVPVDSANALCERWGHYLGSCDRPFGVEGWTFDVDGLPISVAISASTVSSHVTDPRGRQWQRGEIVELARLCTDPDQRWATRPMLRLWREVIARRWSYWPVGAVVAYSQSRRHDGDLYRWDGWELWSETAARSTGGGTWSTPRTDGHAATGVKRLWGYVL